MEWSTDTLFIGMQFIVYGWSLIWGTTIVHIMPYGVPFQINNTVLSRTDKHKTTFSVV